MVEEPRRERAVSVAVVVLVRLGREVPSDEQSPNLLPLCRVEFRQVLTEIGEFKPHLSQPPRLGSMAVGLLRQVSGDRRWRSDRCELHGHEVNSRPVAALSSQNDRSDSDDR